MVVWAVVAGVLGALATVLFHHLMELLKTLAFGQGGSLVAIARSLPPEIRLLVPAAGGVVAGVFLLLARRHSKGPDTDYMDAVAIGDGRISVGQTLLRSTSSLCTITSGGSIGREGPMVQLAALVASLAGRLLQFDAARLRLLVACGAVAGITAAYNAPLAGAFFVAEIVLGAVVFESFAPIVVAAVSANITMRSLPGYQPTYEMPSFPVLSVHEVVLFAGLGLMAGVLAPAFLSLFASVRRAWQRHALPLPVQLGAGGLAVGLVSMAVPEVWGNGYSVVNSLLHTHWTWSTVLLLLLAKTVATAATAGSGAVGGVITPMLFFGAAIGNLYAQALHALLPSLATQAAAYAMVGMGAFLAAATGAPLMAVFMIFEMTLSQPVMLPLMLACMVAHLTVRATRARTMYPITAHHDRHRQDLFRLRSTHMADLIQPALTVLPLTAPLQAASDLFRAHAVKYLYLVDTAGRYQGVLAAQDLVVALQEHPGDHSREVQDLMRRDFLHVITPDMALDTALQLFLKHHGERLPVVQDSTHPVLLGAVHKTALLDAYARLRRSSLVDLGR